MFTELARVSRSIIVLGHAGLQVNLYDDDTETTANQGQQLFVDSEVRLPKAVALIHRTNRILKQDYLRCKFLLWFINFLAFLGIPMSSIISETAYMAICRTP